MLWVISCISRPNTATQRTEHLPAHRSYLDSRNAEILLAGGLMTDDGAEAIGAMFIVDVGGRAQAQAFIDSEPLNRAGVFETPTIRRLFKGRLNLQLAERA